MATIASFGSTRLKILDAMVGRSQEGGARFDADAFVAALEWAIREGARVINSSKQADWADAKVGRVVSQHRDVLFIDTAGNNAREFGSDYREAARLAYGGGNVILVSGVTTTAPRRESGIRRRRGCDAPLLSGPLPRTPPGGMADYRASALARFQADETRRREDFEAKKAGAGETIRKLTEEMATQTEIFAAMTQKKIEQQQKLLSSVFVPRNTPMEPEQSDAVTDDGTSFACPMVANIAAKMLVIAPKLTPPQIIDILVRTSDKSKDLAGKCRAGGVVNPARAYVHALLERPASQTTLEQVMASAMEQMKKHPMFARMKAIEPDVSDVADPEWE